MAQSNTASMPGANGPDTGAWPLYTLLSAAAVGAVLLAGLFLDTTVAEYFDERGDGLHVGVFHQIEKLGESHWYLVPSGLIALSLFWRRSIPGWRACFLFLAVAGTGLACIVLKALLGRPRPKVFLAEGTSGLEFLQASASHWSFPSGHATTAFAVATVLALLWPRLAWAIFPAAALVAVGRIVTLSHYPSDIVAGAWLGVCGALLLWPLFRDRMGFGSTHG